MTVMTRMISTEEAQQCVPAPQKDHEISLKDSQGNRAQVLAKRWNNCAVLGAISECLGTCFMEKRVSLLFLKHVQ